MKSTVRPSWLLIFVTAAITGVLASLVRDRLLTQTKARLTEKYSQQIASLSDQQAARLIARLAQGNDQWLDVIVAATADDRPAVAQTAETELLDLIAQWTKMPAAESSPHAACLAHLLAQQAPNIPAEQRHLGR